MNWSSVTAAFGGTFDPPHLGHREAVRGLFSSPGVQRVIVLPSAIPPQKQSSISTEHRLKMTELNFTSSAASPFPTEVEINLIEIERAQKENRPSYTFDTLMSLRSQISQLAFVIGTDQLFNLQSWHLFPQILNLCHWIILERQPQKQESPLKALASLQTSGLIAPSSDRLWRILPHLSGDSGVHLRLTKTQHYITLVPTLAPPISSTVIRETIAQTGTPPHESLFEPVARYLNEKLLYGSQNQRNSDDTR